MGIGISLDNTIVSKMGSGVAAGSVRGETGGEWLTLVDGSVAPFVTLVSAVLIS